MNTLEHLSTEHSYPIRDIIVELERLHCNGFAFATISAIAEQMQINTCQHNNYGPTCDDCARLAENSATQAYPVTPWWERGE